MVTQHGRALQGLGKTITALALVLSTLGARSQAPSGAATLSVPCSPGERGAYYRLPEACKTALAPEAPSAEGATRCSLRSARPPQRFTNDVEQGRLQPAPRLPAAEQTTHVEVPGAPAALACGLQWQTRKRRKRQAGPKAGQEGDLAQPALAACLRSRKGVVGAVGLSKRCSTATSEQVAPWQPDCLCMPAVSTWPASEQIVFHGR